MISNDPEVKSLSPAEGRLTLRVSSIVLGVLQATAFWIILPPDLIRNEVLGSLILIVAGLLFLAELVVLIVMAFVGPRLDRIVAGVFAASLMSEVVTLVVLYIVNN